MKQYLDIIKTILDKGEKKEDRTGTGTLSIPGMIFEHEMAKGFPLLTTKKVAYRLIKTELEFFIKGITDKQWLIDRNNHIWDEWANPQKASYGHDPESQEKMMAERDLGPIYGFQWRHFGAPYDNYDSDYINQGIDQMKQVVETLKKEPHSRRMLVCAWNPTAQDQMSIPPCHFAYQVTVTEGKLNLIWNQRTIDVMLGLPFNIASYATLLHLFAKEVNLQEGRIVGLLGDTHIYLNHLKGAREQLSRDPNKYTLPKIKTKNFKSIFDWTADDTELIGYQSYPTIKLPIAV